MKTQKFSKIEKIKRFFLRIIHFFLGHDTYLIYKNNIYGDMITALNGKRSIWECPSCGGAILKDELIYNVEQIIEACSDLEFNDIRIFHLVKDLDKSELSTLIIKITEKGLQKNKNWFIESAQKNSTITIFCYKKSQEERRKDFLNSDEWRKQQYENSFSHGGSV